MFFFVELHNYCQIEMILNVYKTFGRMIVSLRSFVTLLFLITLIPTLLFFIDKCQINKLDAGLCLRLHDSIIFVNFKLF